MSGGTAGQRTTHRTENNPPPAHRAGTLAPLIRDLLAKDPGGVLQRTKP
ncbi:MULTISPECIES: hypothetical protein [unclassified Streptomyces]